MVIFLYNLCLLILKPYSSRKKKSQLNVIQSICVLKCEYSVNAKFKISVRSVFPLPSPFPSRNSRGSVKLSYPQAVM